MTRLIRFVLLLCFVVCQAKESRANAIDTLSSKESVLQFLAKNFEKGGISVVNHLLGLNQYEKLSFYLSIPDTIYVEDPVTREITATLIPRDSSYLKAYDTSTLIPGWSYSSISYGIENHLTQYSKVDIDNNGYTDLVINAGGVLVVMDMGNRLKGHILLDIPDFQSYTYIRSLPLQDGTNALLMRRNPCTILDNSRLSHLTPRIAFITDTFITDTVNERSGTGHVPKIDTLYKVITMTDTLPCCSCKDDTAKPKVYIYHDTIYAERYNKIDTIVYQFGDFSHYNDHFRPEGIQKVCYYDDLGINTTSIEINKNGICYLKYSAYDTILKGGIEKAMQDKLWNYISYAELRHQKSNYSCWGEAGDPIIQTCVLYIYYDDGTVKKFTFQQGGPPMGLGHVMKKISDISNAVNWERTNEDIDIACPEYLEDIPGKRPDNTVYNCRCGW